MILKLTNNLSKVETILDIKDKGSTMNFYRFEINLIPNMDEGEYTYQLIEDNEILSNGLLQIGDYVAPNTEYNNTVKYKTFK